MPSDAKPNLTPKLRFPEFREAWQHKVIAPFLEECSARVPAETKLPIYSSTRAGLMRQDDYYDGRVLLNENEYGVVPPGCFVYRHMSDDGIFRFNINETGGEIGVSKEYPVFRAVDADPYFLLTKLNHGNDFKKFALAQKAGGTRTRLHFSKLCTWKTLLPSLGEQTKIAGCLTALDKLLTAEGQKLNALKAHKKGLMQQLFPREGETLPQRRFPEFQNAPEWEEETLGNLFNFQDGFSFKSTDFTSSADDATQVIRITDINNQNKNEDKVYVSNPFLNSINLRKFYVERGDLLLSLTGAAGFNFFIWDGNRSLINQRTTKIKPKKQTDHALIRLLEPLAHAKINARGEGQNNNLSREFLESISLRAPQPAEQQAIADCLTPLEILIATQSDKLEALKTHKRGLMQQLFPSPTEAER